MAFETLADIKQIDMAEASEEYKAFTDKFKPTYSTDDCFTPDNIYEAIKAWAFRRYELPEDTKVIRPFYPGGDYQHEEYPKGCVVIDNPPFSIAAQIIGWYQARDIPFFLFANGLTVGGLAWKRKGLTAVCSGAQISYDNSANIQTNFITNMSPDLMAESVPELHETIEELNKENLKKTTKHATKLAMPDHIVTAARMNYLAVHATPFQVKAGDGIFVRKLDNYACGIYGGGILLSDTMAAERAAAERAAALKVPLSDREKALVKTMEKGKH